MSKEFNRREFVQTTAAAGVAACVTADAASAAESGPDVWVLKSEDKAKLMEKALEIINSQNGFAGARSLTLKVNAAWARTPEQGANTHPVLVDTFLAGCRKAGIEDIKMPEHPCDTADYAFTRSGIQDAAKKNGVEMIDLKTKQKSFRRVEIPSGKKLKNAEVASEFLDCDLLVNMPIAKHHGGATLTAAMKNWLGAVKDRGYWHRNDLHQCIADFASFIKSDWTIIDATRCMLDRGPKGPSRNMITPNLLIVSRDQVAADAFACSLFHDSIDAVLHIVNARDMGLGETDMAKMKIHRIDV